MDRYRRPIGAAVVALAAFAFILLGLTKWIDSATYTSLTAGIQAVGVVAALGLGASTLLRDSNDRRVDRVLSLHQELMNGDLWAARVRLVRHLKALGNDGKLRSVSRKELIEDPVISTYAFDNVATPLSDSEMLVRFFERSNSARRTGALHPPLFVELIGRHAVWWDHALNDQHPSNTRFHLSELAAWARHYIATNHSQFPQADTWRNSIRRDF